MADVRKQEFEYTSAFYMTDGVRCQSQVIVYIFIYVYISFLALAAGKCPVAVGTP